MKDFLLWQFRASPYGWYWLLCLCIVVGLIVLVVLFGKRVSKRTERIVFATLGVFLIAFEVTKQFATALSNGDGIVFDYNFYQFPFQPSSVTMYCIFAVGILKDGFVRNCMFAFVGTYGLLGGLSAYVLPQAVFSTSLGLVTLYTMFLHGIMLVLGVYVLFVAPTKLDLKFFMRAVLIFLVTAAIASIINVVVHYTTQDYIGLFFISPFDDTIGLPLVGDKTYEILTDMPFLWVVYIPLFLAVYSALAYGVLCLYRWIASLCSKTKQGHIETPT